MPTRSHLSVLAFAAFAAGVGVFAAETNALVQASPFLPAPGSTAPAEKPVDTLEFAGVSVGSPQTLISLFDTQEKRGRWIAVGAKLDGIEVINYDAPRDQVAVRHRGELKILTLRQPGKVTGAPAVAPSPAVTNTFVQAMVLTATPPPSTEPKKPLTIAQQEEEARMFVADMLDIGMQHRKAYEEAQKKAADDKAAGVSAPPPPPAAPAPSGG